ncbi:MAG: hypothetical protein WAU11_10390 [Ignavibacteriaceae bacterium]
MRNIFLLSVLILLSITINAQDKVYVSEKFGNALKLFLKEDNTYQLIYNEGVYEQKLDSLYLKTNVKSSDNFTVIPVESGNEQDSIELTFTSEMGYLSTYNIAIATSSGDEKSLSFLPLFSYQSNSMTNYTDNLIKFKIKKEKFLFIAKQNYVNNQTEVSKFEIANDINSLEISENYKITNNLVAAINENGNIVVSENGTNPIEFVLQDKLAVQEKQNGLDYSSVENVIIDWSFPSLYNTENYTAPLNPDTVKINIETSLKEALKNLKANLQSCLLIVNEPKETFDKFVSMHKTAANDLKYYDESDKNIFDFSFYSLTEDDQSWLEKINHSEKTKFIVLGLNENVIYSSEQSVSKFSVDGYYSYEYITLAREIKSVANMCAVNESLLNKKSSVTQLKTALYNASVKLNHRILFPEVTEVPATNTDPVPSTNELDSTVVEYSDYTYPAKLNGVFYKSTITKKELEAVWDKVLDNYEKESNYDKELFHTIYKELNNDGFSMNLFGEQRFILNENDFRAFDYLLKHYQKATTAESNTDYNYDYSTYFPAISDVKYLISNVLSRNLSDGYEVNPTTEQKKEIINRYGNYIYDSPNDYYMLTTYVNSLIANKEEKELFDFYEKFVSRFDTKNILESLNNYYENNYELNWYNLKNDFSTMANNVSWYVVDNQISDPNRIKKAIEWSEMSLKLSRNNFYYMDTLAQLYYKNGDKQKAISIQEEAIKNYKDTEVNPDTLNEMKNVLEKMKSGSY